MISFDEARSLAEKTVAALGAKSGDEFALIHEATLEVEQGWVFFYNTKEFIETGDFTSVLVGNGPILVSRSGDLHRLPTAIPWQEAIKTI